MAENSKIEWTDHTFNPWIGCTKVSPGCAHCYAETQDNHRKWTAEGWGAGKPRKRTSVANWNQVLKWNRDAEAAYLSLAHQTGAGEVIQFQRPRVFCASLADWLDDEVPVEWLADLMQLIWATPMLDWLLLTKRPENFQRRMQAAYLAQPGATGHSLMMASWTNGVQSTPPPNVWIGTTVEDQTRADERIPALLAIPANVRFLSCEPLLGKVNLPIIVYKPRSVGCSWTVATNPTPTTKYPINWVICGGESGPKARPMHPDWARSLRDQCKAAGVPFLFKQWGEWSWPHPMSKMEREKGETMFKPDHFRRLDETFAQMRIGKKEAGRLLDGVEHNGFPEAAP